MKHCFAAMATCFAIFVNTGNSATAQTPPIQFRDAKELTIEGKGFGNTKAFYDRLPAEAEKVVRPPVWSLSRHSAGLCVRFMTDASTISARWKLRSNRLAMVHMPATAVSGVDLYVKTDKGWRWLAVGRPTKVENTVTLVTGIPTKKREYILYLPLYNGVEDVQIGVPKGASLTKLPGRKKADRPLVFYGTSITQGGCASRAGMVHTAILGRRLNLPVINLGFSGNGRMEPEVGRFIAEIDAIAYVIDCLPNLSPNDVAKRTEPLVKVLREKHPKTPIVLVEDRSYADSFLLDGKRKRNLGNRKALRAAFERLKTAGVTNLYYIPGEKLLGDDGEGTVDGSHPTDLGFVRQADAFEKVLRRIVDSN